MALLCPECEGSITIDPEEMEEGETITCEDCGADLEIVSLEPLKVTAVDPTGYDDPEETLYAAGEDEDED